MDILRRRELGHTRNFLRAFEMKINTNAPDSTRYIFFGKESHIRIGKCSATSAVVVSQRLRA